MDSEGCAHPMLEWRHSLACPHTPLLKAGAWAGREHSGHQAQELGLLSGVCGVGWHVM